MAAGSKLDHPCKQYVSVTRARRPARSWPAIRPPLAITSTLILSGRVANASPYERAQARA
jgi:hypothetical protein